MMIDTKKDWIKTNGECPEDLFLTNVEVKFRDGKTLSGFETQFCWSWLSDIPESDIVEYRVIQ
jgi:hypothetical protein